MSDHLEMRVKITLTLHRRPTDHQLLANFSHWQLREVLTEVTVDPGGKLQHLLLMVSALRRIFSGTTSKAQTTNPLGPVAFRHVGRRLCNIKTADSFMFLKVCSRISFKAASSCVLGSPIYLIFYFVGPSKHLYSIDCVLVSIILFYCILSESRLRSSWGSSSMNKVSCKLLLVLIMMLFFKITLFYYIFKYWFFLLGSYPELFGSVCTFLTGV